MNIYVLEAIVDEETFVNFGVFDRKSKALKEKKKWESIKEVKFELYIVKRKLNVLNTDDFIPTRYRDKLKEYLRDNKITQIIND